MGIGAWGVGARPPPPAPHPPPPIFLIKKKID